jgi:galactoside O-acetyltransferase
MLKLLRQYALISSTVIDRGIYMRLDIPEDRKYLVIGDKSIVAGNFYFESRSGKIQIGKECFVGNSTFISHSAITIGDHVTIGWGGTIYDHDSHSLDYMDRRKDINDEYIDIKHKDNFIKHKDWSVVQTAPIIIEDDVWIGMNCIILKGVTIGKGAIVGAGSVITHNVPAWTVVGGNPAKVVKMIEHENN